MMAQIGVLAANAAGMITVITVGADWAGLLGAGPV